MEVLTKCGRCGALVETTSERLSSGVVHFAPCAVTTKISSNDVVVRDGCEYTVLCPDCMDQLKAWLAGESQEQQEAADSAGSDDVNALVRDLARAVKNVTSLGLCRQQLACGYFGHVGDVACLDREASVHRDECPAYGCREGGAKLCMVAMLDDVARRTDELGIDLKEDADAR